MDDQGINHTSQHRATRQTKSLPQTNKQAGTNITQNQTNDHHPPTKTEFRGKKKEERTRQRIHRPPASWTWLALAAPEPSPSAPAAAAAGRKHAPRRPRATAAQHPHPPCCFRGLISLLRSTAYSALCTPIRTASSRLTARSGSLSLALSLACAAFLALPPTPPSRPNPPSGPCRGQAADKCDARGAQKGKRKRKVARGGGAQVGEASGGVECGRVSGGGGGGPPASASTGPGAGAAATGRRRRRHDAGMRPRGKGLFGAAFCGGCGCGAALPAAHWLAGSLPTSSPWLGCAVSLPPARQRLRG